MGAEVIEVEARLAGLGLQWPELPRPVASYVPAVRSGPWLVVSGQLPFREGKLVSCGPVPGVASLELAQSAAAACALNALAVLRAEIGGDWSRFVRVVRLGVYVASEPEFTAQPRVANGASDFFVRIFGEAGKHARSAVGVTGLPLGATVEVEAIFEIR
ncbi:MAG: RidA family protein [Lentisphaeria bacterium]|jgi:enamine deaminase RidA (YjgF/YER057c/UK114 family)